MRSRWSDDEAREFCTRFEQWGEDLALRVYTSRLIGSVPSLVMHGGGNTSVKSTARNLFGEEVEAIYVKGSGWNLDTIEPPGLPGIDLAYLRRLREIERLSDEEMVNQVRTHLFDAASPNPSVETLLHAFLPHKFVDHSHADVILLLTNQESGEANVREALGDSIAVVPYVMPGFDLSRVAAEVFDQQPDCEGMVLLQHGLFTFGPTARESYEKHIELVTRAETWFERRTGSTASFGSSPPAGDRERRELAASTVAPVLRGLLSRAEEKPRRWVLDFRCTQEIADAVDDEVLFGVLDSGPLTPDHVIRTKEKPWMVPAFDAGDPAGWRRAAEEGLDEYRRAYVAYFEEHCGDRNLERLDSLPRLIAVRGLGIFAVGANAGAASIAGDLVEHTVEVKCRAQALGPYCALGQQDLFDVEYWSLEQAKLGRARAPRLQGSVALVTGAGGAIGSAVVRALALDGAAVVATDVDPESLAATVARANSAGGARCVGVPMDVTDEASVAAGFRAAAVHFGGLDLVVLNAGIARSCPIDELSLADWNRVLDVNLNGYFVTLREAVRLFKSQGTGGNVVVNASKNVFAPGAEFAAYSVSKAGGHQLGRLAAIELAPYGIRVNMINPDAIFSDRGEVASGLWKDVGTERARSRGLDLEGLEEYYRNRNLLKVKISAEDVARAVLFFAREETPTTGATLPVDGGLPAAMPR